MSDELWTSSRGIDSFFCLLRNALNIVKDDLIARVDLLTSEKEIAENRLHQAELQREAGKERIEMLETEVKKLKVSNCAGMCSLARTSST